MIEYGFEENVDYVFNNPKNPVTTFNDDALAIIKHFAFN